MAKEFVLKINGEPAAKTIKGIQDQISALDEQIKNSDINNPDFDNLVQESNKAKQALGILQKEGVEGLKPRTAIDGLKEIGQSLSSIPGPIGGAISGFQGLSKAAMGFVMNPIGAVITALVAVFAAVGKAINSTEKGTFALNKIFGALGGVIKPITKAIGELAVLVAEGLVKAMEAAIEVGKFFGLSFAESADAGMKLAQTLNEIEEEEGDLAVARALQNKQLAETRALLADTNASYEDRKKALDQIRVAETNLAQQEVDLAKKRLSAAQERARQEGESKENLEAIEEATIKLLNTEQELAAKRRQFNQEERKLRSEEDAKAKERAAQAKVYADERIAAQDKIRAAEQKNLLASIKDEDERNKKAAQLELENSKREIDRGKFTAAEKKKLKLEADKTYALQVEKINKDTADKELALQKELADALVNTDQEKFDKQQQDTAANYDKLIEKAKGNSEMIAKLEAQKLELLAEQQETFDKDQAAKKKAAEDKVLADAKEAYEKRISEIESTYAKEASLLEQKGLSDRELRKEQDQIELKELEDKLAATEKNTDEYYKLELELYRKKKEIRDKDFEETIGNLNAGYDMAASLGQGLMELDAIRTEAKLANENLTEEERERIAKESFEKQKKLQYAMALIDAAKAVTSIIAQYPKFDGGFAMTAALITTGITTAFNIAKISATQYQSKTSSGSKPEAKSAPSRYQMGGVLSGPTHDMGGIKTALGELEGGEFVVNRRSTANFLPILEQLNNLGNVPGAQVPPMTQAPIVRTYVVASDMTSQQEADSKLSQLARLD